MLVACLKTLEFFLSCRRLKEREKGREQSPIQAIPWLGHNHRWHEDSAPITTRDGTIAFRLNDPM